MKKQMWQWPVALVTASLGIAEMKAQERVVIDEPVLIERNRLWGGARAMFNVKAEFSHGTPFDPGPGPGVSGANHNYENGYVRVDDSGNAGGLTWNWGFQDIPGQPPSVVGTTLQLRSTASPAAGSSHTETEPYPGFEVGYSCVLSPPNSTKFIFGFEGAFNMTWLDVKHNDSISGTTQTITDTYDLSGLPIIPSSPYTGSAPTPGGPVPLLIPDSPVSRTILATPATVTEYGRIKGYLYGFQLGPFVEVPIAEVVAVQLRGGLTVVLSDTEFTFSETLGSGAATSGTISDHSWLFGGYAELKLLFKVAPRVDLYLAGGYQRTEDHQIASAGQTVKLDMKTVATASAGVSFSF
jgi:hypothetical protein